MALYPGIMRRQLRVEGGIEIRGRFKDRAVEVKDRVGNFLQRPDLALPHFLSLPERFEDLIRIDPVLLQAPDLHHRGPALGLGGMGGQHRLNLQFVQAAPNLFRRDTGLPKLLKKVAQRHRGRLSVLQVADPGALLTQVDDLKEQAQRVGDLVGLANTKPMNEPALAPNADAVVVLARRGCELPNPVQVLKQDFARLLPDNGIQPARQALDFFCYDYAQCDLT